MHTRFAFLALPVFALLAVGCPKAEGPNAGAEAKPASDGAALVCCESFGYGAMMEKCCESYAWTSAEACVTEEGFVGGGKGVVDAAKCSDVPAP